MRTAAMFFGTDEALPRTSLGAFGQILRKEVIQPQVPLRLPCYDFTPVADPTVVGRCVQGLGTYSPRRADPRLLAIPPSCSRVAENNPN
jgi:hypothetical protein